MAAMMVAAVAVVAAAAVRTGLRLAVPDPGPGGKCHEAPKGCSYRIFRLGYCDSDITTRIMRLGYCAEPSTRTRAPRAGRSATARLLVDVLGMEASRPPADYPSHYPSHPSHSSHPRSVLYPCHRLLVDVLGMEASRSPEHRSCRPLPSRMSYPSHPSRLSYPSRLSGSSERISPLLPPLPPLTTYIARSRARSRSRSPPSPPTPFSIALS